MMIDGKAPEKPQVLWKQVGYAVGAASAAALQRTLWTPNSPFKVSLYPNHFVNCPEKIM